MADITMCANQGCPRRKDCHRFTATESQYWQPYSEFKWDNKKGCDDFWSNEGCRNGKISREGKLNER